jgi:hypothetical protein
MQGDYSLKHALNYGIKNERKFMRSIILTILAVSIFSGCAVPIQKKFIKPNVDNPEEYTSVDSTSSLIGYSPELKNQIIIEKLILNSLYMMIQRRKTRSHCI